MKEFVSGYLISESGEVFNKKSMRKLTPQTRNAYLSVHIRKKNYPIHRLVATHFVSNEEKLPVVRHKDGNRFNNHYTNLAWGTTADNAADALSHGTHTCLNSAKFKQNQNVANVPAKVHRKRNNELPIGVSERVGAKGTKYIAKMANQSNGQVYLGSFDTVEEAYSVVKKWYFTEYGTYPGEEK